MKKKTNKTQFETVIEDCLPLLKALTKGRCAVTIGGSHGSGTFDERSDIDFRVFADTIVGSPNFWQTPEWKSFSQVVDRWGTQGIKIDYCWPRTVHEIETQLEAWLSGQVQPIEMVWTLWGYHLPTDLLNQQIIDDPAGLLAAWQSRLRSYPLALRQAILEKHLGSLRYWRTDYHYRHKVERGDVVFLAGMASRLVHDMIQVLFAFNRTYYVGDGNNLSRVAGFPIQPENFVSRIQAVLYPSPSEGAFEAQYTMICGLIDDLLSLEVKVL
jgi:hypothetical protein